MIASRVLRNQRCKSPQGSVLVCVLVCLVVATSLITSSVQSALHERRALRTQHQLGGPPVRSGSLNGAAKYRPAMCILLPRDGSRCASRYGSSHLISQGIAVLTAATSRPLQICT